MNTTHAGDDMKVAVTRLTQKRVEAMAQLVKLRLPFRYNIDGKSGRWLISIEDHIDASPHQLTQLAKIGFKFSGHTLVLEGKV